MSEPFIAEIRIFGGNFAPRNWAFCDGGLLPISQNTALFSLVGTIYGGDGRTTFGLPNLQGRAPMHAGRGPGLQQRSIGQKLGSERVTLAQANMPTGGHTHTMKCTNQCAEQTSPAGRLFATTTGQLNYNGQNTPTLVDLESRATKDKGGGQSHNNMQPFLAINFIIALAGTYPSRS